MTNYILPKKAIQTYPPSTSNQITKEYFNMLIDVISRGNW